MAKNNNLNEAKVNKYNEFYTRLTDIEHEISMHQDYVDKFQGKIVYCNCDTEESDFWLFFQLHFRQLGLKKVILTHYNADNSPSYKLEWEGKRDERFKPIEVTRTPLEGNGDFQSPECVAILDECDIVVTNPPFSLFRAFVKLIIDHGKDMVVIGNKNAITYKEVFPLIKENKLALGYESPNEFKTPDGTITKQVNGLCRWYTTLDLDKYHEELFLGCKYAYHPERYPKYDNYDAINVDDVKNIPNDYDGVVGVPITFLDKHCPDQFEILWILSGHSKKTMPTQIAEMIHADFSMKSDQGTNGYGIVHGKQKYHRLLIRRRPSSDQ